VAYQGESEKIENCIEIGQFLLEGLKESPDDEVCIKFELDKSGLLHVTATDVATGKKMSQTMKRKSKASVQTANLADLKSLHLHTESDSVVAVEEVAEEEESSFPVPLNEELIARALAILSKNELPQSELAELRESVEAVKRGEPTEKLEELLYYLD
jgi:molecular chaperone DnaK (HSP70)